MKTLHLRIGLFSLISTITASPIQAQERAIQVQFASSNHKMFEVVFSQQQAIVKLDDGKSLLMDQAPSGSGFRYVNTGYILCGKGQSAAIELNGKPLYESCISRSNTTQ